MVSFVCFQLRMWKWHGCFKLDVFHFLCLKHIYSCFQYLQEKEGQRTNQRPWDIIHFIRTVCLLAIKNHLSETNGCCLPWEAAFVFVSMKWQTQFQRLELSKRSNCFTSGCMLLIFLHLVCEVHIETNTLKQLVLFSHVTRRCWNVNEKTKFVHNTHLM